MFAPPAVPQLIPSGFECPITFEIMNDPVTAADGHSYERAAIEDWFRRGNNLSPNTGLPFPHLNLLPNWALRQSIADWRMQQAQIQAQHQMAFAQVQQQAQHQMALAQAQHQAALIQAQQEAAAREAALRQQMEQMRLMPQARPHSPHCQMSNPNPSSSPVCNCGQAPMGMPAPAPQVFLGAAAAAGVAEPQIGEYREGGVVFYVDRVSRRALVSAIRDVGSYEWYAVQYMGRGVIETGVKDDLFAGAENTRRLCKLGAKYEAAIAASGYREKGYGDWHLPSRKALFEMYRQKGVINAEALKRGGSVFNEKNWPECVYWSSSEYSRKVAFNVGFDGSGLKDIFKHTPLRVRPIRAFNY